MAASFRQTMKRITPRPLRSLGSQGYWWWRNRGQHLLSKSILPSWRENQGQVRSYRDLHARKRCFLIGNGPSLRKMDLSHLRNEFSIGLNRIYLLFPEIGFPTT
jgi:hypothetical protein